MKSDKKTVDDILDARDTKQLPLKSKKLYLKEYNKFENWRKTIDEQESSIIDKIVLAYLVTIAENLSPNTLYQRFSIIRSCLISTMKQLRRMISKEH